MQQQEDNQENSLTHLRSISSTARRYRHFGVLLAEWRKNAGVTQQYVVDCFSQYCSHQALARLKLKQPGSQETILPMNVKQYGKLERQEKRAPKFGELLPLYLTLTLGCGAQPASGDREAYVELARTAISQKIHHREAISPEQWNTLADQLALADGVDPTLPKPLNAAWSSQNNSSKEKKKDSLHQGRYQKKPEIDTSYIIGRNSWMEEMVSLLTPEASELRKKVIVIRGERGIGKTTCLKLLSATLQNREGVILIEYTIQEKEGNTSPQEALDTLLATILLHLEAPQPEEMKLMPLNQRIERVMSELTLRGEQSVILLDNAQVMINASGIIDEGWQLFLTELLTHKHQTTLWLATRQWATWWSGTDSTYLLETNLSPLSPTAGMGLWHALRVTDIDNDLLLQAVQRCGGNPHIIKLLARRLRQPRYTYTWKVGNPSLIQRTSHQPGTNELSKRLERLLDEPLLLDPRTDHEARSLMHLLQLTVNEQITLQARHLLETLALSPLPVPYELLSEVDSEALSIYDELLRCSLVEQDGERANILPLTREALLQAMTSQQRHQREQTVLQLYENWLEHGSFLDEQEQAELLTSLTLLYLKAHLLFSAAELLLAYGWLSFAFGHGTRLARLAQETMDAFDWRHTDVRTQIGGQLLSSYLAQFQGQDIPFAERAQTYQYLYELASLHNIEFQPTTEIHLVQHLSIFLARHSCFSEAQTLIAQRLDFLRSHQEPERFIVSLFLQYQSYILLKWSEYEEKQENNEIAANYLREAVELLIQCISLLRESVYHSSQIRRSSIEYRLARRLTDLAYYGRKLGMERTMIAEALRESIGLKKRGYALPGSLGMAYGEYAELLAEQGHFQKALEYSELALQEIEKLISSKHPTAMREQAVLQVVQGHILLYRGELDKAGQLFVDAKPYLYNTTRETYFRKAEQGLQKIVEWRSTSPEGKLDWRWYKRYERIADYDTHFWLSPAGPFTEEEQGEWKALFGQMDYTSQERMSQLITRSRDRELAQAVEAQREPLLFYPAIPIDEVQQRIGDCLRLRKDIEQEEDNTVVRDLYLTTLDEQLDTLRMIETTQQGDATAFRKYNHLIFPVPTAQEMHIAANEMVKYLKRGMRNEETAPISLWLFRYLQELQLISPYRHLEDECKNEAVSSASHTLLAQKTFSAKTTASFFKTVLSEYQFGDWDVIIEPGAVNARVEPQTRSIILTNRPLLAERMLHMLSHELESHVFRFAAGEKSRLSLLGLGTGGYLPTEEALAGFYDRLTAQIQGTKGSEIPWVGTIATGLASGAKRLTGGVIPAHSFYTLYLFYEKYHLLDRRLTKKHEDWETAKREARRQALSRCIRTWRGSPHPLIPGACSVKDNSYLRGYLDLQRVVEARGRDILDRLMVGAVSVDQLDALAELGMVVPAIPHKRLAHDPNILQYIASFEA